MPVPRFDDVVLIASARTLYKKQLQPKLCPKTNGITSLIQLNKPAYPRLQLFTNAIHAKLAL